MSKPVRSHDHRLEIQERLKPALRDLGLVRRVLGVPARIFQNISLNHRRRDACRNNPFPGYDLENLIV